MNIFNYNLKDILKTPRKLFLKNEIKEKKIQLDNHFNTNKRDNWKNISTEIKIKCEISRLQIENDSL